MRKTGYHMCILILLAGFSHGFSQISDVLKSKLQQKVVSLEFHDKNISDLLRLISRQNGLNIVISPEVNSQISISLYDVTVEDALKTILHSQGYQYMIESDVIMVKSFDRQVVGETDSRLFHLKYLDALDVMNTLQPLLSVKGKMEVLDLVKSAEPEKKRSDVLLVKDIPYVLEKTADLIEELDQPQVQLLIEVKLIETILDESEKFGIDWPKSATLTMTGVDPSGSGQVVLEGQGSGYAAYSGFPVRTNTVKLGILTMDELNLTLDMLARDEDAKLVSNPKVTTMNNKKAMIRIGTNIPIPRVSRGIGGDLITYEDKRVDVVLEVIPRMEPGDKINLVVHPSIEEIVGYTGSGDFPQPITSIREIQTTVSVSKEETVVLGGMVKDNETTIENKVWLLGDIPLLGKLFTSTSREVQKKDLLIFITPKILGTGN